MPTLILDGPEKAGKSSLARRIQAEFGGGTRHWSPVPHDKVYAEALREDYETIRGLMVWDRSWASESVYDLLLDRGRLLGRDPWFGEWMYGRATRMKIMLLGPSEERLRELRSEDDQKVDPGDERREFAEYGRRFGWWVVENEHNRASEEMILQYIRQGLLMEDAFETPPPPVYCGPSTPRVLFVGESRNENAGRTFPGAWLPFTSRYTVEYGRILGDSAFSCGWANADDCPAELAMRAKVLVACGGQAHRWAASIQHPTVVSVPHPSWLYRWGDARTARETVHKILREVIRE